MSELQIALIAIGALIILAVLIINWWQERRFHNQVEKSFSPLQRDALLDEGDLEESHLADTSFDELNAYEPNFEARNLNEPKFHTNAFDSASSNTPDNRASNHFSIDETTKLSKQPLQEKYVESDRFIELPNENAAELLMHEDKSIDDSYSEIINSKLDKLTSESSKLEHEQLALADISNTQTSDFKAVFDQALTQQGNTEENQAPKSNESITTHLEDLVSLPEMLHGQMDLTALLYLSTDTSVSALHQALVSLFDDFDKPIFVHVLDSNKQWHLLKEMQSNQAAMNTLVSKVACSMQLADRGGAVDRSMLNRFQLAVETLGLDINGHVEWQNPGDALNTANSLDLFCIEVDKTIGFHLVHGDSGAFTGTKLRGVAEAQGLKLASDGTFKYFDQSLDDIANKQHPSFVMFNREDHPFSAEMLRASVVKSVTFQLDIPHVKHSAETFTQMIQIARQMEIALNATLVDSSNKVLGDIQVEKIRQQIKVLQATMLVRGIVPGSDSAHRLFS
ncbi:MAG: cell division protein ZipA C-terminal FtsZ-binding domain-containing protein [Methylotenera sp.]|uniref:cell division protein ZipA C-terminal FtsZ-binding domain-containing protein n=1 Tax=Methylotenera sp. TaxID=2051956 RepID=UPI00248867B2|nr:cell division protein ZipA C-terminal FtsZ-binding domain-containing protein [Methylotenera sp.]MDI1309846.1 cell division protein ZipA C-terminal FtsZ-binding domain-containing protein [Methylotenera sp.]